MKLGRNLAAGLASSLFVAFVGLAVVPLYLKYLGIEAYGLIGFFAAMQALFQLLDMGLSQTLNREIARYSVYANWRQAGNLLHTLAAIYWGVALLIAVLVFLLSPLVAGRWIKADNLAPDSVLRAVQLIGVVIACRWPIGLYLGALNGLQLNTITSAVTAVMTALGSGGAVLLLAFVSPTIEVFFIWQGCVGLLYALTLRKFAWRAIRSEVKPRFEAEELRRIWSFATGVAALALSGIFFTQVDKVILSKMLTLTAFGYYMLATAVAGALYFLIAPVFNVIYPRFSALVATGSEEELRQLYRVGMRLLTTVLFPLAWVIAAFSHELVRVWTGSDEIAASVAPLLSLLSAGTALHCVMYFPYALQLAYGLPRLALQINVALIAVFVPVTAFLAYQFGAIGGAAAWLFLHVTYVLLGTWLTHRRLLKGIGVPLFVFDILRPMMVSLLIVFIAHYLVSLAQPSALQALVVATMAGMAAIAVGLAMSPEACRLVVSQVRARRTSP
jgi:O-antigen/teichoic acid export membrane protein